MENVSYLLVPYLFRHAEGRKSRATMSGGYFIRRLAEHFSLVSDEGLVGLSVITSVLLVIDLDEIVKIKICVAKGTPNVDEGAQAILALVQAPQPPAAA
ncbi:hypothetical protein Tco_0519455 [Tanacetum coccineum]